MSLPFLEFVLVKNLDAFQALEGKVNSRIASMTSQRIQESGSTVPEQKRVVSEYLPLL